MKGEESFQIYRYEPQICRVVEGGVRSSCSLLQLVPDGRRRHSVEIHADRRSAPHRRERLQPPLGVIPVVDLFIGHFFAESLGHFDKRLLSYDNQQRLQSVKNGIFCYEVIRCDIFAIPLTLSQNVSGCHINLL